MLNKRSIRCSKSHGAGRLTLLILGATLLVGLGAASPALADHDYRGGSGVSFWANLPLPFLFPLPLPIPVPVPVVHRTTYWNDYRDYDRHEGHYRRHHHDRYYGRHGYRDDHKRYAKHRNGHKRNRHHDGRRNDHRRH